ncbi:enoyl-CoA hydratase-related protein [Pseudoroseicyclus tamaricis]|uniref:Enoyl-CoA hydratase n=1 Tax=Pseudoroseicyclus tamaricis TaxID=2705421 RepID=A0A6B2JWP7_9RHOB|nr:enoyl-CoA hydratase-related protein [Pseudoroseicyclus tamaricis]NDV02550.1 enoyl-CoA hydratase [Pseudoroseicyclus tamaricis]
MAYKLIKVDTSDEITTITLNRPEAMNALSRALLTELGQALEAADKAEDVRVIIVTGSEKAFAAGADVAEMAEMDFAEAWLADLYGPEAQRLARIRKPVIAAVAGYCLGGGCELAMLCDTVIAADTAKFGQPEINLGIIAGMGGTQRMARAIGKAKTMDLHLTGRMMDAEEAERAGLVSRVVPARELLEKAREMADKIAEKSQISAMAAKEAVNAAFETSLAEGLRVERKLFLSLFATEDQAEGMEAFRQKREPQFRDR